MSFKTQSFLLLGFLMSLSVSDYSPDAYWQLSTQKIFTQYLWTMQKRW